MLAQALVDIGAHQELTLDYNASEYELLGGTFTCSCGSPACVGEVRGWRHLSGAQRAARAERCQPWLLEASAEDV